MTRFLGLPSILDRVIERRISSAIDATVDRHLSSDAFIARVHEILMENPRFVFIKHMQARYAARAPSLSGKASFGAARDWLNAFLRSEKVEFGDPAYDWSSAGAHALADEDLQYWEAA